jgi:hypothetical protein
MNKPASRLRSNIGIIVALLLIVLAALVSLRCGTSSAEMAARAAESRSSADASAAGASATAPAPAPAAVPHGDHNPHHGGAVLMLRDLHYEIVFEPTGRVAVYFSDAVRKELPASVASDVYIEIDRPKHRVERIEMAIDDTGEWWEGKAMPVKQDDAVVRVAFTFQGEATSVDLPWHLYWKMPAPAAAAGTGTL